MQVGDCVAPKSGGYLMTISAICSEAICICQWFDESGLHQKSFWQHDLQQWTAA